MISYDPRDGSGGDPTIDTDTVNGDGPVNRWPPGGVPQVSVFAAGSLHPGCADAGEHVSPGERLLTLEQAVRGSGGEGSDWTGPGVGAVSIGDEQTDYGYAHRGEAMQVDRQLNSSRG